METALIFHQGQELRASRPSRCSSPNRAATPSAPTTSRSWSSRARAARASSWAAAPGARAPTGARSSATTPMPSRPSTAGRWRSSRSCAPTRRPRAAGRARGADRPARRCLRALVADDGRRRPSSTTRRRCDALGHARRHRHGAHDHLRGRGDRHRARRARAGLPVAVSFTVETDGRLPSGQTLRAAIEQVDAETDGAPLHYMINCAHPTHFAGALATVGRGASASGACARTPPRSATPSWTRPRSSTTAIPATSREARRAARLAAEPHDARRLLRHRHPPRHEHRRRLARARNLRRGGRRARAGGVIEREEIVVERARIGRELRDRDARRPVDQDRLAVHAERRVDAARPVVDPPLVVVEGVGRARGRGLRGAVGVDQLGIAHADACDPVRRHDLLPERRDRRRGTAGRSARSRAASCRCRPRRAGSRSGRA